MAARDRRGPRNTVPAAPPGPLDTPNRGSGDGRRAEYLEVHQLSGPLPPPAVLREFEDVHPGLAERIVTMAENQAAHRQAIEAKVVDANIRHEGRGQWISGTIAITMVIGSTITAVYGSPIPGIAALVTTVVSFALLRWSAIREHRRAEEPPPPDRE